MSEFDFNTPVLFIIFNRPETTRRVFEEIRKAQPKKLYIAADGPRNGHSTDGETCHATRKVVDAVDWNCDVFTDYSETNLGCRDRVISAIDWIFRNENQAIILEDDCLPHSTFFRFCQELLKKYQHDTRIMSITGSNPQRNRNGRNDDSYFFSYFPYIWGWATWKRAWELFDVSMTHWFEIKNKHWLVDLFGFRSTAKIWTNIINASSGKNPKINTWDHQWKFSCLAQSAFCILPKTNLIKNIGFEASATHTTSSSSAFNAEQQVIGMEFPMKSPRFMIRDSKFELFIQKKMISPFLTRLRNKLMNLLKEVVR